VSELASKGPLQKSEKKEIEKITKQLKKNVFVKAYFYSRQQNAFSPQTKLRFLNCILETKPTKEPKKCFSAHLCRLET
jgi:hypothetical protein